jgi:hypothetical protein
VVWHKEGKSVGHGSAFHDYHVVRSVLLLVRKFYPHLLPLAVMYSVYRCLLPKVVRLQYTRFRAVLRAYGDLLRSSSPERGGETTGRAPGTRIQPSSDPR